MAHAEFEKNDKKAELKLADGRRLGVSTVDMERPEVVEKLEQLDDVIFPAIEGDEQALAASEPVWREAVAELGPEVIEESRSEYLRYARSVWQFLSSQAITQPLRLLAVMKIIGLLMGDDV
jgi:hypothetical protein